MPFKIFCSQAHFHNITPPFAQRARVTDICIRKLHQQCVYLYLNNHTPMFLKQRCMTLFCITGTQQLLNFIRHFFNKQFNDGVIIVVCMKSKGCDYASIYWTRCGALISLIIINRFSFDWSLLYHAIHACAYVRHQMVNRRIVPYYIAVTAACSDCGESVSLLLRIIFLRLLCNYRLINTRVLL